MVADRGQLLLVGAILFSVVVVGIVVQLNDLQYTDSMASDAETGPVDRAAQTEAETRDALVGLSARVRADTDRSKFGDALRENVSTYQSTSLNMTAAGSATYTNVTLNETASVNETEVTQPNQKYQRPDPSGGGSVNDWGVATDTQRVTAFWLNTTSTNGNGAPMFTIQVTNSTGEQLLLRLNTNPSTRVTVQTKVNGGSWMDACDVPTANDIKLDLIVGTGADAASVCGFPSFTEQFNGPYTINFENGNKASGTYRIGLVEGVEESNFNSGNLNERLYYPAIDYQYRSPSTSYNRTFVARGEGS